MSDVFLVSLDANTGEILGWVPASHFGEGYESFNDEIVAESHTVVATGRSAGRILTVRWRPFQGTYAEAWEGAGSGKEVVVRGRLVHVIADSPRGSMVVTYDMGKGRDATVSAPWSSGSGDVGRIDPVRVWAGEVGGYAGGVAASPGGEIVVGFAHAPCLDGSVAWHIAAFPTVLAGDPAHQPTLWNRTRSYGRDRGCSFGDNAQAIAFTPDGSEAFLAGGLTTRGGPGRAMVVASVAPEDGRLLRARTFGDPEVGDDVVNGLVVAGDGRQVLIAGTLGEPPWSTYAFAAAFPIAPETKDIDPSLGGGPCAPPRFASSTCY